MSGIQCVSINPQRHSFYRTKKDRASWWCEELSRGHGTSQQRPPRAEVLTGDVLRTGSWRLHPLHVAEAHAGPLLRRAPLPGLGRAVHKLPVRHLHPDVHTASHTLTSLPPNTASTHGFPLSGDSNFPSPNSGLPASSHVLSQPTRKSRWFSLNVPRP